MPNPAIGDVACMADPGSSLATALRAVCRSVVHLGPDGSNGARHPLVVVDRATLDALRVAAQSVAPDGWLYAEVRRGRHGVRAWLQHPRRCGRELQRLGFDRVAAAWHRPDFERAVEITPLCEPAAGRFLMSRAPVNAKRRVQLVIGRFLLRSGLLPFVVPCFSVLAHRNDARPSDLRNRPGVQPPR